MRWGIAGSGMWLDETFPNLTYEITSDSDGDYNCIAWAVERQDAWWSHLPGYRWIGRRNPSIESLMAVFRELGYEVCDSDDLEPEYDKAAPIG